MTWIDWTVAAIILFSALLGLRRGVIVGLVSALGVVVAYLAASFWYLPLAGIIGPAIRLSASWAGTVAFAALLLAVNTAVGFAALVAGGSDRLSPFSRLLGLVAGAIRGALLALALLAVAVASPPGDTVRRDAERSVLAPYALAAQQAGVEALAGLLPERYRPFGVGGARF